MAKKTNKSKHKSGGHLSAVPSVSKMPLQLVLNLRVVDSLTPDFVRWFDGQFGEAADAMQCLKVVKLFLTTSQALGSGSSATRFQTSELQAAAETLAATLPDGDAEEALDGLYDSLHLYVDYLIESGQWTGSDAEHTELHGFLTGEQVSDSARIPEILPPDLSDPEQDQAFSGLPLIERATRLLEWIGAGREVTSTGVLRLKDIQRAAAAVGVRAVGKRAAKRAQDHLFHDSEEEWPQDTPLEVGTMHDVPVLRDIWAALVGSSIVDLGSTRAAPGPRAALWNHEGIADSLRIRRDFITAFLADALTETEGNWYGQEPELDSLLAVILAKGTTAEPMEVAELARVAQGAATGDIFLSFSALRAQSKLAALADLGLVKVDSHYTVAPVVIQSLAGAIAYVLISEKDFDAEDFDEFEEFDEFPDFAEPGDDGGPVSHTTAAAPPSNVIQMRPVIGGSAPNNRGNSAASTVFQLKIQLKGSKPPIWRRVLVPGSMRLDELHEAIQGVFEWLDYHLHSFEVGGFRGVTYGPNDGDGVHEIAHTRTRDESKAAVKEVLKSTDDKMDYIYDFGDNWVHQVTLEKISDAANDPGLPRCTGGRGLAPSEDSGGVWGWADKIEAANSPSHEDHADIRDWLGLAPGEVLDPKDFDVAQADAELERLR